MLVLCRSMAVRADGHVDGWCVGMPFTCGCYTLELLGIHIHPSPP